MKNNFIKELDALKIEDIPEYFLWYQQIEGYIEHMDHFDGLNYAIDSIIHMVVNRIFGVDSEMEIQTLIEVSVLANYFVHNKR